MAKIELLAPKLAKWEGGFVNHPADKGGATNKGVTITVYKDYCKKKGKPAPTVGDLKNLSDEEWAEIIVSGYWSKMQADKIENQSVANLMVDWLVNSGTGKIKDIQKILCVSADGIVGPKTIAAINDSDQAELFQKVWNRRKDFYDNIVKRNPAQKVFYVGWMNRLNDYKFEV